MPTRKKITFFSLAPYLYDKSGHYFHYHRLCQQAVEKTVDAFYVYLCINPCLSILPRNWKKWFHFSDGKERCKLWRNWIKLFRQPSKNRRFFFLADFAGRDFCYFSLAALLFAKKSDTLGVFYRMDLTTKRKIARLGISFFTKLLKIKFSNRFVPFSDNSLLIKYYGKWFETIYLLPIIPKPPSRYQFAVKKRETLVCLVPGIFREEKGAKEIFQLLQIDDPKSAFIEIHAPDTLVYSPVNQVSIRFHKQIQIEEKYYKLLYQSDVVLLPYDPIAYKWRSSGCFVETILAGKIPLVKEGSWLATELKRFELNELIVNWDNKSFFTDLLQCVKKSSINEKLVNMQKEYTQTQSEETFRKTMQEILLL